MTAAKFAVLHTFNVRITLEITTKNVKNNVCCTIVHKKDLDKFFASVALSRVGCKCHCKKPVSSSANIFVGQYSYPTGCSKFTGRRNKGIGTNLVS
jgi:hypothetical protein